MQPVVHTYYTAPCTDGQLRLAGGNVVNEGRVEICLNNEWGTICDDNWSIEDAKVACSILGFSNTGEMLLFGLCMFCSAQTHSHNHVHTHVHIQHILALSHAFTVTHTHTHTHTLMHWYLYAILSCNGFNSVKSMDLVPCRVTIKFKGIQ